MTMVNSYARRFLFPVQCCGHCSSYPARHTTAEGAPYFSPTSPTSFDNRYLLATPYLLVYSPCDLFKKARKHKEHEIFQPNTIIFLLRVTY